MDNVHAGGVHPGGRGRGAGSGVGQRRLGRGAVAVLVLTGAFHLYRGAPIDGTLYLGLAAVLAVGEMPTGGGADGLAAHSPRMIRRRWAWLLVPGLATILAFQQPGVGLGVALLVLLGAMLALGWRNPKPSAVRASGLRLRRSAWAWAAVVLFLCLWELGMYFTARLDPWEESTHPPLSDLIDPLFLVPSSRWLGTVLWVGACAALVWPRTTTPRKAQ